jgi:Fe-S oxidoreductase
MQVSARKPICAFLLRKGAFDGGLHAHNGQAIWFHVEQKRPVRVAVLVDYRCCNTIWLCVGCHTCSSQCPNSIGIAAIMDALRQLAIHDGVAAPEADIFRFHKYIYGSIQRHGRLNKLEAMIQFKVGSGKLFSDLQSGLKMVTRGKLELTPQRVAGKNDVDRIFSHYDARRRSFNTLE